MMLLMNTDKLFIIMEAAAKAFTLKNWCFWSLQIFKGGTVGQYPAKKNPRLQNTGRVLRRRNRRSLCIIGILGVFNLLLQFGVKLICTKNLFFLAIYAILTRDIM